MCHWGATHQEDNVHGLVLFGGRKIPEFMKGLGKGIREFNDAKNNVKKELEDGMNEKDKVTTP